MAADSNDRAIELSERSHVELVLYARGLEIEREELLSMLRQLEGTLAELARREMLAADARNAIERLLSVLPKRSLTKPPPSAAHSPSRARDAGAP
jgi:hypothetical protein